MAAYQLVLPVVVAYMSTHVARAEVPPPNLGAPYEDVTLHTSDGLTLRGWYVPSKNGAAIISFPGRKGTQEQTRMLVEHGYGVLLFDRRGEGVSEGDGNMFGWGGERDIFAALDFLEDRPDVDPGRIGGVGLSVGGELMLQAAAEDERLAAVVSEGAGTRTLSEEKEELSTTEFVTNLPLLLLKTGAVATFSNTAPPPSLTDLAPRIAPRPSLLIWAPNGGNREEMSQEYYRLGRAELVDLGDPGRHAHPGSGRSPGGVREARGRLLRRRPPRLTGRACRDQGKHDLDKLDQRATQRPGASKTAIQRDSCGSIEISCSSTPLTCSSSALSRFLSPTGANG